MCRQVKPKRELIRLVRTPGAGVRIDPSGKQNGRGAYLCGDPRCWAKAAQSDVLNKALRTTLTEEERAQIAAYGAQLKPQDEIKEL